MEFDAEPWKELHPSPLSLPRLVFAKYPSPPSSPCNYTRAKYADYYSVIKQTCFLECHPANIISQRGVLSLCKISFVLFAKAFAKICVAFTQERERERKRQIQRVREREREKERASFYNQTQGVLSGKTPIISVVITRVFPAYTYIRAHHVIHTNF
jgi:hypothetical protein